MMTRGWLTISVCGRQWCWMQPGCQLWCRCRPPADGGFAAFLRDTEREEKKKQLGDINLKSMGLQYGHTIMYYAYIMCYQLPSDSLYKNDDCHMLLLKSFHSSPNMFERQTESRAEAMSDFMCWYSSPGPASPTCWWGWCCQGGGYQTPGCDSVGHTPSFLGSTHSK